MGGLEGESGVGVDLEMHGGVGYVLQVEFASVSGLHRTVFEINACVASQRLDQTVRHLLRRKDPGSASSSFGQRVALFHLILFTILKEKQDY